MPILTRGLRAHRCLLLAALAAAPARVSAQTTGWHSVVEANASTLFGATAQTLTAFTAAVSHGGSRFTADAGIKFRYGESEDAERITFVNTRSWALSASVDAFPERRVSPFFFGSAESSLEKRLSNRRSGGVGAKWRIARTESATASLSVAALGERTLPMSDTGVAATTVVRWSWRAKVDHRIAERVTFSHTTFYGPVYNGPKQYTITSTSVGSFALNKAVALTLTFTDNYDSQARARGAPTNNDGALLFGVRGNF